MVEKLAFVINKKTCKIINRIVWDETAVWTPPKGFEVVFPDEQKREHTQDINEVFGEVKSSALESSSSSGE